MPFCSPRRLCQTFAVLAVCLVALLGPTLARPADAANGPAIRSAVFQVDGEAFTIDVIINKRQASAIRGPINVVVTLPAGGNGGLVSTDRGFQGKGWSFAFRTGTGEGSGVVAVTVPSRVGGTPIEVDLASDTGWAVGAPSTVNTTTTLQFFV